MAAWRDISECTARTVDYAQSGRSDIYERFCFLSQLNLIKNVVYRGQNFVMAKSKGFVFAPRLAFRKFVTLMLRNTAFKSFSHKII